MIYGRFGNKGQGKGISVMHFLNKFPKDDTTFYANCKLNFPYKVITPDMIIDIIENGKRLPDNSVVYISEITQWLDARGSGSNKLNKVLSYFILMSRKMGRKNDYDEGLPIIYDSQYPNLIDIRLWESTDFKTFCKKHIIPIEFLDTGKPLVLIEEQNFMLDLGKDIQLPTTFVCANLYYETYDSREIIQLPKSKYDR